MNTRIGPLLVLLFLQTPQVFADFDIDSAGYQSHVYEYAATVAGQDTAIVFIPGKGGKPDTDYLEPFFTGITGLGYDVLAPVMPWSDWRGSRQQSVDVIRQCVNRLTARGKKVVLVGHSMGAGFIMHYAADQANANISGVVVIAPGHLIHRSGKMRRVTAESVERARKMLAEGRGDEQADFADLNQGREYSRWTTPRVYLDYFDPERIRDINEVVPALQVPLLWLAGEKDRLNDVFDSPAIFSRASQPGSDYRELPGGHKGVVQHVAEEISDWLRRLQG